MTTAADIIRIAKAEVGYTEQGNNITKYWAELEPGFQGNPWCAAFVSWVFKQAGKPLPSMGKDYGFSYCPYAEQYAKKNGLWDADGLYQPGDVILFGSTLASHTGIVVADDGRVVTTIEGNTSSGDAGSQTNGGGVYLRSRPHGPWVRGVVATSRLLDKPAPAPAPAAPRASRSVVRTAIRAVKRAVSPAPVLRRGSTGSAVKALQRGLNGAFPAYSRLGVDGDFGPATDRTVREFQRRTGLTPDGVVGPATRAKLKSFGITF